MDSEERDKAVIPNVVSYVAFESVQARNERHIKRLWITNLVLITLLFLSNAIWLWFYSGFDFESYEADIDAGDGNANYNYIGNDMDGDISYGTNTGESKENDEAYGSTRQNEAGESDNR